MTTHPWHWADEDCACGAQRLRQEAPASLRTWMAGDAQNEALRTSETPADVDPGTGSPADPRRSCNASGCDQEGDDVLDHYGIPAGRWCADHEDQAPGQFAYAGPDTEPLDEDQPNPGWRQEDA